MKLLIDTNVWLAYYIRKDRLHKRALSLINNLPNEVTTVTHDLILLELFTLLKNKKHPDLEKLIFNFLTGKLAFRDKTPFALSEELIDLFLQLKRDISIVDTFLVTLTQKEHYTLATFDKNLSQTTRDLGIEVIQSS